MQGSREARIQTPATSLHSRPRKLGATQVRGRGGDPPAEQHRPITQESTALYFHPSTPPPGSRRRAHPATARPGPTPTTPNTRRDRGGREAGTPTTVRSGPTGDPGTCPASLPLAPTFPGSIAARRPRLRGRRPRLLATGRREQPSAERPPSRHAARLLLACLRSSGP